MNWVFGEVLGRKGCQDDYLNLEGSNNSSDTFSARYFRRRRRSTRFLLPRYRSGIDGTIADMSSQSVRIGRDGRWIFDSSTVQSLLLTGATIS